MFWDSPHVVRFGPADRQEGFAEVSAFPRSLARNAIPWSFVGFPAISIPCGPPGALPVGLQLVAAPGREDLLVALGRLAEDLVA